MFIVRDWQNDDEISFGLHQNEVYLEKIFNPNISCGPEHKFMKNYLNQTFGLIQGLFLPYPGGAVNKKPCSIAGIYLN